MTQTGDNIRLPFIDALRGLAVMLMVQQHLQAWLWNKTWVSYNEIMTDHPVMGSLNFAGLFAAPLFFLLAGYGSAERYSRGVPGFGQIKRGYAILGCAYLLNLFSPHWFAPWSWYALHCIGAGLILSPLFHRTGTVNLLIISLFIILLSVLVQSILGTPLLMSSERMNDIEHPGGALRLIVAEGHFPLVPWISFFITGVICHRLYIAGKVRRILIMGIVLVSSGFLLGTLYSCGFVSGNSGFLMRFLVFIPFFYPPLPSLLFLLLGSSMIMFYLFAGICNYMRSRFMYILVYPGRSALSWSVFHILFFNEFLRYVGFHKCLCTVTTVAVTVLFISVMVFSSKLWSYKAYRYGVEWAVRKYSG